MLDLTTQNLGDVAVLHCAGRMTAGSDAGLRNAVVLSQASVVVLDLAGVNVMDAAGLGTLVDLRARAQTAGKLFKLMNLTPRVESLLRLTRLKPAFEVCSLREMLDLICRAAHPLRAAAASFDGGVRFSPAPEAA